MEYEQKTKRAKWLGDEWKIVQGERNADRLRVLRYPNEGNIMQLVIKQRESKKDS